MALRYRPIALAFMGAIVAGILWGTAHYHDKYLTEQKTADAAEYNLSLAN